MNDRIQTVLTNPTRSFLTLETPIGTLTLIGSENSLEELLLPSQTSPFLSLALASPSPLLLKAERQLQEYFEGKRKDFDLPLSPKGTEFQQSVWAELRKLPFGSKITYGELAKQLKAPKKARAVGLALGRNPLPIFLPCHRVIGANGKLGGFSGGLPTKLFLLNLETPSSNR